MLSSPWSSIASSLLLSRVAATSTTVLPFVSLDLLWSFGRSAISWSLVTVMLLVPCCPRLLVHLRLLRCSLVRFLREMVCSRWGRSYWSLGVAMLLSSWSFDCPRVDASLMSFRNSVIVEGLLVVVFDLLSRRCLFPFRCLGR